jgi:hypothetical protein
VTFWVIFIAVAVVVGVGLIFIQGRSVDGAVLGVDPAVVQGPRYEQFRPLSETEQELYWRLVEALPECVVLAKVPFARFMKPPEAGEQITVRDYRVMNARMSQRRVDFLVCLRDFTVVAAVDLDDASQRRDLTRDELLKSAGVVPLRVFAESMPSVEALRGMFTASR